MPLSDPAVYLDEKGSPVFSDYYLSKWSAYVRVRDGRTCQICHNECEAKYLHSHHIFMKHEYPELAYQLWNGISACYRCHNRVIHSDACAESAFRALFWPHMYKLIVRDFNVKYQPKITEGIHVDLQLLRQLRISPYWMPTELQV